MTVPVHPICHRALHVHLTNIELAKIGDDPPKLRVQAGLATFLRWVANKPPDFHAPTRRKR
ncbi:hypothetical protein [Sphingomonas arenae]|uniref:hypothetical protein n=1 Tax=Sphingomonas arenae TaxID=2812555 RepID=UPI0030141956